MLDSVVCSQGYSAISDKRPSNIHHFHGINFNEVDSRNVEKYIYRLIGLKLNSKIVGIEKN